MVHCHVFLLSPSSCAWSYWWWELPATYKIWSQGHRRAGTAALGTGAHRHRDGFPRVVPAWCERSGAFRPRLGKTHHSTMNTPPPSPIKRQFARTHYTEGDSRQRQGRHLHHPTLVKCQDADSQTNSLLFREGKGCYNHRRKNWCL